MTLALAATTVCAMAAPKFHGEWRASSYVDKMTDEKSCYVIHRKDPYVRMELGGAVVISFQGRGGVEGYEWRVDKNPPSPLQLTDGPNKNSIRITEVRTDLRKAKKLIVGGMTVTRQLIDLEYNLTGLAEARADAAKLCGVADPMDSYFN